MTRKDYQVLVTILQHVLPILSESQKDAIERIVCRELGRVYENFNEERFRKALVTFATPED